MTTHIAYQFDRAGIFCGAVEADESPLEPGVFLLPARATFATPPAAPEGMIQRWNGVSWELVTKPTADAAVVKLQAFLASNPDVAALIQGGV